MTTTATPQGEITRAFTFRSNRHRVSRFLLGAVAALLAALATACGGSAAPVVREDGTRVVRVATLRQPHLFHPDFYERFLPGDVRVEVIPFADSTEVKNAVATGSADFGVTGITSALQGAAQGQPFVVVASAADGGSAIVAREGDDVNDVSDLRGRRIGYVPGSAQDILLRLTLRQNGLDPESDVELVNIGFSDMADALAGGEIEAFSGAETGPSDAVVAGGAKVVTYPYATPVRKLNIVLGTSRALIEDDARLVELMVRTHAQATNFMADNQDEWAMAVSEKYGFGPESVELAIDNIDLRWDIDANYIRQAGVLGEQLEREAQSRGQPDYEEFFDTAFVDRLAGVKRAR